MQTIECSLRRCVTPADDVLSVSLMPSVASSWLVPRLPDFAARHPEIQINLQSSTDLINFDQDPIDVAIRLGAGVWAGLSAEHLFDEWLTPVASPALVRKLGRDRLRDLAACPLLGDPGDCWTAWLTRLGE